MNLAVMLARSARLHPDRPAVLVGDQVRWSYRDLGQRAASLAAYLRHSLGLDPGARVALYMRNHASYLEVMYAAWWAGLVVVPINAKLHAREVEYILTDSGASALFITDALEHELGSTLDMAAVLVPDSASYDRAVLGTPLTLTERAPGDLAWLFYTSGTTGRPKGVMLSHRNLATMTACYFMDVDDVSPDDTVVYAAPMSHGAGLYNFAFIARAARHVVPASGGFEPSELVELSDKVGHLCLFAAPTMVKRLVDHVASKGLSAKGFKTIVYGGGPMYVQDIVRALDVMGPRFVQIYGQGESPMTITALARSDLVDSKNARWHERIASVGVAQSLVEVRVVDDDGKDVPPGVAGEVVVRGDTVMSGYWCNADASAQALRGGWLWTGDMGTLDADGFLTLKDRSKDVIISGGSNIYPREVEEVLLRHAGVREVAVIGQIDAQWGETVTAFVVGESVDAAALDSLCLAHIARFKRPTRYVFVAELPKNNYGKVLKTELRRMLESTSQPD